MQYFEVVDAQTTEAYNQNAARFAERYESADGGVARFFPLLFEKGQSVLDIGCGSGRDMAQLARLGCDVWGLEPAEQMRAELRRFHHELAGRVVDGPLPDLPSKIKDRTFDGISMSAVLMHIPDEQLFDTGVAVRSLLRENAVLLLSVCTARDDIDQQTARDSAGRLFRIRSTEEVRLLFERLGFSCESTWMSTDALARRNVEWATLIFRYRGAAPRPIDRVESIINRDRKVATYKFALLRALAEIVQTAPGLVSRNMNGTISIPMHAVSDLWIQYYWPFVEDERQIPQTFGKGQIAFYGQLHEMAERFKPLNGLSGFLSVATAIGGTGKPDFAASAGVSGADQQLANDISKLRRKVAETIRKGPVTYAGQSEFSYSNGSIVIQSDLWRELVLMGHWISDSILVRWAELTSRRVTQNVSTSEVIQLLIQSSDEARMDSSVRNFYKHQSGLLCAWTGRRLHTSFEVDHIIPFAIRRDSAIWNLVPATRTVNNNKSDKLPTLKALSNAEERITGEWRRLRDWNPDRFDADAAKLLHAGVRNDNWEQQLFQALVETVEYTATLRDVDRWTG